MVSIRTVLGLGAFVLFAYACSDSSDPGARVVSGLERAQCDAKLFRADSDTCLQSFATCRASNDAATCRDAYVACLPAFPANLELGGRGRGGDEGDRDGKSDRQNKGRASAAPQSSAFSACAAARATCITSTTDPSGCGATAAECVRRAIRDAFVSKCADAKTRCDDGDYTEESCATITTRCTQGEAPATIPDTQCSSPAAPALQPVRSDASTADASAPDSSSVDSAVPTDAALPDAALPADASTDAPVDG